MIHRQKPPDPYELAKRMAKRPRPKEKGVPGGFEERRDPSTNQRRAGWRWVAARSDRRQRHIHARPDQQPRLTAERYGGRRRWHRRKEDRDDDAAPFR